MENIFCHRKQFPLVYIYFYLIPAENFAPGVENVPRLLNRRIIFRQAGKSLNFSSPTPFLKREYTSYTYLIENACLYNGIEFLLQKHSYSYMAKCNETKDAFFS